MSIRKTYPFITPDTLQERVPEAVHGMSTTAPYLEPTVVLEGWPGHRNLPEHSGLDPVESNYEAAHITGVLLYEVFRSDMRPHSALYLLLVPALGVLLIAPLAVALYLAWIGDTTPLAGWVFMLPLALLGAALLAHFTREMLLI